MINKHHQQISVRRQSQLLAINRSSLYIQAKSRADDTVLCNIIAELYATNPIYGYRRIKAMLGRQGIVVNHKKVLRLMRLLNIRAIYPKPNTSKRAIGHQIYRYLLSDLAVSHPNQVWQIDITYLRTAHGFMYLVALIDVYSRMVMGYCLSNDLSVESCLRAVAEAIDQYGAPVIINSDQGSQFTSGAWVQCLQSYNIKISMTGKGRCHDNANIERLWRSFKYEGSYLYQWHRVAELKANIPKWISWYNSERPHQALGYLVPVEKYYGFMDKSNNLPTIPQYQLRNY